jgi:Putative DNA-binding domain
MKLPQVFSPRHLVQSLADIQLSMRNAVVAGNCASIAPLFVGGRAAERRLAIHRRHYQASLTKALLDKFPATVWLAGSAFVTEAVPIFISEHPPATPCIAEYGESLPSFLAKCRGADRTPYLQAFAELEWHIGHVAIAIDKPSVAIEELRPFPGDLLPDVALILQTGVRYLKASWPVDELLRIYLAEIHPERFEFAPAEVNLEIRGSRGEFSIGRLSAAEFIFRTAISLGRSIGESAEEALETDRSFDVGRALVSLFSSGLVSAVEHCTVANQL